jgi:hypothetical protein
MCAGADSIDDIDVVRSGGLKTLFHGVYAPLTVGTLLRQFILDMPATSNRSCAGWWRCVRGRCAARSRSAGVHRYPFAAAPLYGQAKQAASYRHTKIAGGTGPGPASAPDRESAMSMAACTVDEHLAALTDVMALIS